MRLKSVELECLAKLVEHNPKLKSLRFSKAAGLNDTDLATMSLYAPDLRTLEVPHQENITDKGLESLKMHQSLEELNLARCERISYDGVVKLLQDHPNLKNIDVTLCAFADQERIAALRTQFPDRKIDCNLYRL